jgi:hypothetical protein
MSSEFYEPIRSATQFHVPNDLIAHKHCQQVLGFMSQTGTEKKQ